MLSGVCPSGNGGARSPSKLCMCAMLDELKKCLLDESDMESRDSPCSSCGSLLDPDIFGWNKLKDSKLGLESA